MRLVVGVIGHVDHGKTALVHALTGTDTDRLAEEKRRGISIALGFAHLSVDGGSIDFIDMPGHERFVRTMVGGATGMHAALLVVAATEGIMPQTREHLEIAALLGIRHIVVAVSKTDLPADPAAAGQSAATLVRALSMQVVGTVLTSARTGKGVDALRALLASLPGTEAPPTDDGFFFLPVDRAFTMPGHGTVVTGTLRRGRLAVTDEVALLPGGRSVRLRGLQVHGARLASAEPGQRVAANLRDIEPRHLPRGTALAPPGLLQPATWLSVRLTALASAPPLANGLRLVLLAATLETEARIRLLDRDTLEPGETARAQLHTAMPVALPARERFILRRPSPPQTLAGGMVLDPEARRLPRSAAGRPAPPGHAQLAALSGAAPAAIVRHEIAAAAARGVETQRLARLAGLSPARAIAAAGADAMVLGGQTAVSRASFAAVAQRIGALLAAEADGLARDRLAALLPEAGPAVLEAAIASLAREGRLRAEAGSIRLHVAERETARAADDQAGAGRLAALLHQAGLMPPDPATLMPAHAARRLTDRLVREGTAIRTFDVVQKREVIFHRDAIESARRTLAPHLAAAPGLRVGEAAALLGISRKYAVPLLEHLDAIHFTRRQGDRRQLAAPATPLAGAR